MATETIVIYGSGPNCTLRQADHSYFANYAALRFDESELATCGGTRNLIGNVTSLFPDAAHLGPDHEAYLDCERRLSAYHFDHKILFATKPKYHRTLESTPQQAYLSPDALTNLITGTLGRTQFFTWPHLLGGALRRVPRAGRMIKQALRGGDDTDAYFRPSSGVMALIIALNRHGPEHRYDMQGFEFKRRSHDHVTNSVFVERSQWYLPHLEADRLVLRDIQRRGIDLTFPAWS